MKYEITKEQLRSLTDPKVKEMFPEAFELGLEVGKWYKANGDRLINVCRLSKNDLYGYGFGNWGFFCDDNDICWNYSKIEPATNQEVSEALINEAKKLGYEESYTANFNYSKHTNFLWLGTEPIFNNGIWAEITEPTFEYLEEVEVSDYEDFGISRTMLYGCKDPMGGYCCFTKTNKLVSNWPYIKKIKP